MNAYQTLRNRAQTEYIIQKSRFIGHAAPVSDVEDALWYLDTIRKEHRDASHNSFAYVIGQNKGIIRYSDDGEPSGTAGKPIAEVLLVRDVVNCAVVVTRYFGGILLGAGGLVRAYAHTAALALEAAGVCAMYETGRWSLRVAYPLWDRVERTLRMLPVIVERAEYAEDVMVLLLSRIDHEEETVAELMKVTDGKIQANRDKETFYHPWGI
jgi:uncharacterized YigZ family protein